MRAEPSLASACSAKALSKYTDLVDSLARQQRELLEGASDEARVKLREWELPEALNVRANSCLETLTVTWSGQPQAPSSDMPMRTDHVKTS